MATIGSASTGTESDATPRSPEQRQAVSSWSHASSVIAKQTTRALGNVVQIGEVVGKGILHTPTEMIDDSDAGILYSRASGSYQLEIVRDDFVPPLRGDEVVVDGMMYRAISDAAPMASRLDQFADGEVWSVPLAKLS